MIVKFLEPYESTPSRYHGIIYHFPFEIVEETPGARRDSVEDYQVKVEISGTLLATWGFNDWAQSGGSKLLAATLFEYVRDEVIERITKDESLEGLQLSLNSAKVESEYLFDVEQLTKPEDFEAEIDLEALRRRYATEDDGAGGIGFDLPADDDA